MTVIRAIVAFFKILAGVLMQPGQLWKGLREIAHALCRALCRLFCRKRRRPETGGEDGSLTLGTVYKRPDPLIYAQYYFQQMGLAVTWDNPDIELFEPAPGGPEAVGAAVSSSNLEPGHVYRVRVRISNGSYDAPAVGLPVHLSFLSFGVGTTSDDVGTTFVDLGVKGSAHHPALAFFDWKTPAQGHYCLQARLEWSDDANPDNNLGQENVNVGVTASPATFSFALRNDAAVRREFVLEADTYALPEMQRCVEIGRAERTPPLPQTRLAESRARWERAKQDHAGDAFPVPPDWTLSIEPSKLALGPQEQREIKVVVEPGPTAGESEPLNVNAYALVHGAERVLAGGVTLYVEKH